MVWSLQQVSWSTWAIAGVLVFSFIQRRLRYAQRDAAIKSFPSTESYRSMTLQDAFVLQARLAETEFPMVFSGSVFFALFKTYGIPTISRLLVATGQLANAATASKRAADTGVILTEVVLHHPSNDRALDGIARMNYLHNRYRKSGKISDEDMLYTLSLFVLEPIRWTNTYEWRRISDVERCAMGVYWRWMGDAMEIPFDCLTSSRQGWRDGLHFLDDLETWSQSYEQKNMVPSGTNKQMADGTVQIAMTNVPKFLQGIARDFVSGLLDPRLRRAMMLKDPSPTTTWLLRTGMRIRAAVVRHLLLPRPHFLRKRWFTEQPDGNGRLHSVRYVAHPWYIKPTILNRFGIKALLLRLAGGHVPGNDGQKYQPEGYVIADIGPERLTGKGKIEMETDRVRVKTNSQLVCPFTKMQ